MATEKAGGKTTNKVKKSARKATSAARQATGKAATKAKDSTTKSVATARATRAARAGRVEDAREIVEEAELDEGMAASAIGEAESLHYQVEVNKRGLSVSALTGTLNDRWANGWRLVHMLEQRGNTVLVFEKRT